MTTHTETQAMCDDGDRAAMPPPLWQQVEGAFSRYGLSSPPGGLRDEIVMIVLSAWGKDSALISRQQETIDCLREAAKGSAVIVNTAKAEIDQRDLLLGEAKSILSLLVSDKTTSTSSQSIWAQCVSLECRIRAALQAKS